MQQLGRAAREALQLRDGGCNRASFAGGDALDQIGCRAGSCRLCIHDRADTRNTAREATGEFAPPNQNAAQNRRGFWAAALSCEPA